MPKMGPEACIARGPPVAAADSLALQPREGSRTAFAAETLPRSCRAGLHPRVDKCADCQSAVVSAPGSFGSGAETFNAIPTDMLDPASPTGPAPARIPASAANFICNNGEPHDTDVIPS